MRADLVDRAVYAIGHQRPIGTNLGRLAVDRGQNFTGAQHATFDQLTKGNTRLCPLRGRDLERVAVEFADVCQPFLRDHAIGRLALDPDVVVAGSFIAPATRAALEDLGMQVVTFGIASDVASSEEQIRELASLAGNPQAGQRLIERIGAALTEAEAPDGRAVDVLLWQPGGIVAGEQSLVSDLLARTGFTNGAPARGLSQADYVALEDVVAAPPQVLLVAGGDLGQQHPVLDRLPDMRRERFDTSLLYCGGPTIIRAARRLAEIRSTIS